MIDKNHDLPVRRANGLNSSPSDLLPVDVENPLQQKLRGG